VWTVQNKGMGAWKYVLTSWVSKVLRQVLTVENILSCFCTTGIYLFNIIAMDSKMSLSSAYCKVHEEDQLSVSVDLEA
jgi:hypothetical protein